MDTAQQIDKALQIAENVANIEIEEYKKEIKTLREVIEILIHHAENDSLTYSVLEHARKLIFTPDGPNSVNH